MPFEQNSFIFDFKYNLDSDSEAGNVAYMINKVYSLKKELNKEKIKELKQRRETKPARIQCSAWKLIATRKNMKNKHKKP